MARAKSNTGGYMMTHDRVRLACDLYDGKTKVAGAGAEGVVVSSTDNTPKGFVRVNLDSDQIVTARHKVLVRIGE